MNTKKLAELFRTDIDKFQSNIKQNWKSLKTNQINEFVNGIAKEVYEYNMFNTEEKDKGYLYCLYNEMYNYYGDNVYKLGNSNNVDNRLSAYTTSYLEDSKVLQKSVKLDNKWYAENMLFYVLDEYRLKSSREFFRCPLKQIIDTIKKVEKSFTEKKNIIYTEKYLNDIKLDILKYINLIDGINIDISVKRGTNAKNIKELIVLAEDINESGYCELKNKKLYDLTLNEKLSLEKYLYKKNWGIKNLDDHFMKNFFGKPQLLNNLRYLLDKSDIKPYETIFDCYKIKRTFNKDKLAKQKQLIKDVVHKLGFNLNELGQQRLINRETFKEKISEQQNNELFWDCNKRVFNDVKPFMGCINKLLKEWGLVVCVKQKSKKIKIDEKTKVVKINYHYLDYHQNINQYL